MNTLRRIFSSSKHYFFLCKADITPSSLTRLEKELFVEHCVDEHQRKKSNIAQ